MSDSNPLERQILETGNRIDFLTGQFRELNAMRKSLRNQTLPAAVETIIGDLSEEIASLQSRRNVLVASRP